MSDEYIKEILIALINKGQVLTGADNTEIAKNMAIFINTLKEELKGESQKPNMTMEEIVERVQNDVVIDFDDDDIGYNDTDDTSIY